MSRILIIDDDDTHRRGTALTIRKAGHEAIESTNEAEATDTIKNESLDLVITDMLMPPGDGMEKDMESGLRIIKTAKSVDQKTSVIVMTAHGSIENAVEAMRMGAFDYLTKPFSAEELKVKTAKALEQSWLINENIRLSEENEHLKINLRETFSLDKIIGQSLVMRKLLENIHIAAQSASTVLIRGESGTGKELAARAIHYNSPRRGNLFVTLNCACFPSELIEDELFGHRKGAFTGSIMDRKGAFEEAHGGSILLDEIGEMPLGMQPRLLRVLEQKEVKRIGENISKKVDVRVIAATNHDLERSVSDGRFRSDLFERLNVLSIYMPPLRERKDDIPILVQHFMEIYSKETSRRIIGISQKAMDALMQHSWPRNVRELRNVIERTIIFMEGDIIDEDDLRFSADIPQHDKTFDDNLIASLPVGSSLEDMEKLLIAKTLQANNWNKSKTAEQLGIKHPKTLLDKIRKYNLIEGSKAV